MSIGLHSHPGVLLFSPAAYTFPSMKIAVIPLISRINEIIVAG
jgi:hypothetical protein